MLFESYLRFLTLSRLVPRLLGVSRNSELAYLLRMTFQILEQAPMLFVIVNAAHSLSLKYSVLIV